MKRFYESTGIEPTEGGFAVTLDGKPARTPAKRLLALPTGPWAEAVAAEWAAQESDVKGFRPRCFRLVPSGL